MKSISFSLRQMATAGKILKSMDMARQFHISRVYAQRLLGNLVAEGLLTRVGTTRGSFYIAARKAGHLLPTFHKIYPRKNLEETRVFEEVLRRLRPSLKDSVLRIFRYAFTEMLNNAIEHSRSSDVEVLGELKKPFLIFSIIDTGVGIFHNVQKKFHLKSHLEALRHLLKGKQTTAAQGHSGQGIFFTSKVVETFTLRSAGLEFLADNVKNDQMVKSVKLKKGTTVECRIKLSSQKDIKALFDEFTDHELKFSKTQIVVRLYQGDTDYVSRSEARNLLLGLEKFDTIILDFDRIEFIGQGFADEIFRVYKKNNPQKDLVPIHMIEPVSFMVNRAMAE